MLVLSPDGTVLVIVIGCQWPRCGMAHIDHDHEHDDEHENESLDTEADSDSDAEWSARILTYNGYNSLREKRSLVSNDG